MTVKMLIMWLCARILLLCVTYTAIELWLQILHSMITSAWSNIFNASMHELLFIYSQCMELASYLIILVHYQQVATFTGVK